MHMEEDDLPKVGMKRVESESMRDNMGRQESGNVEKKKKIALEVNKLDVADPTR